MGAHGGERERGALHPTTSTLHGGDGGGAFGLHSSYTQSRMGRAHPLRSPLTIIMVPCGAVGSALVLCAYTRSKPMVRGSSPRTGRGNDFGMRGTCGCVWVCVCGCVCQVAWVIARLHPCTPDLRHRTDVFDRSSCATPVHPWDARGGVVGEGFWVSSRYG